MLFGNRPSGTRRRNDGAAEVLGELAKLVPCLAPQYPRTDVYSGALCLGQQVGSFLYHVGIAIRAAGVARFLRRGYPYAFLIAGLEENINRYIEVDRALFTRESLTHSPCVQVGDAIPPVDQRVPLRHWFIESHLCLLYTSDAADDLLCVDLGGRRIIKKK